MKKTTARSRCVNAYVRDIGQYELLGEKELYALIDKAQAGDEAARDKIVCHNLRLVVYVVSRFYWGYFYAFEDLVSCGNMGLMIAVKKYDKKFDVQFATYATMWIRQQIQCWIFDHSHTVRVPHSQQKKVWTLRKEMKNDKRLTLEKLSQRKNIDLITLQQIAGSMDSLSLNSDIRIQDEAPDEKTYIDIIKSQNKAPIDSLEDLDRFEKTLEFISTLPKRSQHILIMRFGLDDGEPKTLDEISKIYDISRERVRQIEEDALEKLRNVPRSNMLKDLIA